ncbi:MAG: hypothetical protein ACRYG7_00565 [Janthinobacterium lividum]
MTQLLQLHQPARRFQHQVVLGVQADQQPAHSGDRQSNSRGNRAVGLAHQPGLREQMGQQTQTHLAKQQAASSPGLTRFRPSLHQHGRLVRRLGQPGVAGPVQVASALGAQARP